MENIDFNSALDVCLGKTRRLLDEMKGEYPRYPHAVVKGRWSTSGDEEWKQLIDGYWTGGFWVGLLLLAHKLTGEEEYYTWARKWMDSLAPRAGTKGLHDLGFLFVPSAVLGYELTGDVYFRDIAMEAAGNLAGFYSGLYKSIPIRRRPPLDRVIAIDTMMNLPLLWWGAKVSGNDMWKRVADNHASTTMELLIRENSSTFQLIKFEIPERKIEEIFTWQGRAPDSCWSRGQAWAVSGFAFAHLFTGNPAYRRTMDATHKFLDDHLPEDGIPYWDLMVDGSADTEWKKQPRDTSAIAAAAHAFFLLDDPELKPAALKWLSNLVSKCLVPENENGMLAHVCFHNPAGLDVDCSCMFAEFYFFVSLALASGRLEPFFSKYK